MNQSINVTPSHFFPETQLHVQNFTVFVNFITPPLKLKSLYWNFFENLRFSFVFRNFRAEIIILILSLKSPSNSNRLPLSENFEMGSRGGGIKINKDGSFRSISAP